MKEYIPTQKDIVWIDFDPTKGHEQSGHRPALVISKDEYNKASGLCICVPITSSIKGYPFEVRCDNLNKDSVILSDQIKSIDYKARGLKFIAKCDDDKFYEVIENINLLIN